MSPFDAGTNDMVGRGETFSTIHKTAGPCQSNRTSLHDKKLGSFNTKFFQYT
jgi:hypothetical protein